MSIFSGLFWGIFLLAAGLIILLKLLFNLQVSAGRLIFGLFVLMIGVSLLTGNAGWGTIDLDGRNAHVFSGGQEEKVASGETYSTAFGSGTYDASDLKPGEHVKINCAFGSCRVILPDGDVYVDASSAFGSVHLPGGDDISFIGGKKFGIDGPNAVRIEISNAFGSVDIVRND